MKKSIAFFDFDGTITTKDTMLEIVRFVKGDAKFYAGLLMIAPTLVALKLKLITATKAKEKMLTHFLKGMPVADFDAKCKLFTTEVIDKMVRPKALQKIKEHQQNGNTVVLVTASASNWISCWCSELSIPFLSSRLEVVDGKITGKLSGANCNGEEKANRILADYKLSDFESVFCYGDTSGDTEMLKLASEGQAFFRHFEN